MENNMQMIDVMKRLAELDASNPNIIKESQSVKECGPMGMMDNMGGASEPKTPATINITADSGEELGSMLAAIMQLAGVQKVEPEHLGVEHEPMSMSSTPTVGVASGPDGGENELGGRDDMRQVLDKMNDIDGEEGPKETDESEELDTYGIPGGNSSPNDPTKQKPFKPNEFANQENPSGGGDVPKDHESRPRDRNQPTATFENLMKEYKKFIGESAEFGFNYAEQLAQKVFNANPNLPTGGRGDEYFDAAWPHMVADLGKKTASHYLNYDEDFPSDTISAYSWLQKHSQQAPEMEEGIEDRLKDLDPKNPVNIPAYKRKAASGDSADAARNTKEEKEEWHPSKHVTDPQKKKELAPHDKDVQRGSYKDRADYLDKGGVPRSESANESMASMLKLSGLTK